MDVNETMTLRNPQTGMLEVINLHTGELVVVEGEPRSKYVYTVEMAQAICNLVREGKPLTKIATMEGMPTLHTLFHWQNRYPDFKQNLKDARKDRAEYYHDKAAAVLEEDMDKEDVPAAKLKFDGFLKLAERGNPDQYASKPNVLQGGAGPATIIINTGITREPTTVEAEYEKVCTTREQYEDGLGRLSGDATEEGRSSEGETFGAETSIPEPVGIWREGSEDGGEEAVVQEDYQEIRE